MSDCTTKTCIKCGVEKPVTAFNKNKQNKDGLNGKCKDCMKEYRANYYEKKQRTYSSRTSRV